MNVDPQANPYPNAGEIIDGKYKIEKLLGEGGMGAVARATHVVLGGTLALKFMNPQFMTFPGAVERFVNEGRASKAIKSDHVLPVNEIGLLPNGAPYLCMECLYGLDLADLLARDGPSGLPIQRAVHFTIQILRGLQAAHAINIIHRDMKPSNCFVVQHDSEDDWVKILDFGISKIQQPGASSLTQTNSALGTPLYMSPEQARSPRDVDHRSDIYSVGVILYELLCGRTPFFSESGEFTEILFQLFTADPPPIREARPDLPEGLAFVVHKALAREVADRYSSATELAEALLPFASPRTALFVERMQNFKPPSTQSVMPGAGDGPSTAMDALSQLRHGQGTEHMASRPTTDVQKGGPVTEVLDAKPAMPAQKKTAFLEGAPPAGSPLGKAKTQYDPNIAKPNPGAITDGGQAVDPLPPEQKRSPLIYAMPALGAMLIGALVVVFVMKNNDKPGGTTSPSSAPPSAVLTVPTAPASTIVAETPSAKASETPSAAVSVAIPTPSVKASPAPAPSPRPGDPTLNQPGHW